MGKNGRLGKDYGKVVGKDSKSRPGWRGPGYVKKSEPPTEGKTAPAKADSIMEQVIPVELQQLLLNIFRDSFPQVLASDTLQPLLQNVKSALYERDFERAFGMQDHLEAYSIRWSPSRALCYVSILVNIRKHLAEIFPSCGEAQPKATLQMGNGGPPVPNAIALNSRLHVACFGGGAAEVVAFGGFVRYLHDSAVASKPIVDAASVVAETFSRVSFSDNAAEIELLLVDTAQWRDVVQKLQQGLITPPPLSKYASSSAKDANSSLIGSGTLTTSFQSDDLLELSQSQLSNLVGKRPLLLTLLFTLNELYTASIAKTTVFLLNLTSAAPHGTLLLVVDSPGSYSETTVGTEAKKYPMQWLLDHTLLGDDEASDTETAASWQKLVSENSRWFRLPDGLRYPISLENMRYQLHLYRRM